MLDSSVINTCICHAFGSGVCVIAIVDIGFLHGSCVDWR